MTAAEVGSETVGDDETAFLAGSAAGGLPERVPPMVFTGAGDDGGPASLRAFFLQERTGGTGIEAAVALRNSANALSIFWTRISMLDRRFEKIAREQHTP